MLSAACLSQVRAKACISFQASWEQVNSSNHVRRTKSSIKKQIIVRRTVRSMFGEQTFAQLRMGLMLWEQQQKSNFAFRVPPFKLYRCSCGLLVKETSFKLLSHDELICSLPHHVPVLMTLVQGRRKVTEKVRLKVGGFLFCKLLILHCLYPDKVYSECFLWPGTLA